MDLKARYFDTASALTAFVNNGANSVTQISSIAFDAASGKYVLFYRT